MELQIDSDCAVVLLSDASFPHKQPLAGWTFVILTRKSFRLNVKLLQQVVSTLIFGNRRKKILASEFSEPVFTTLSFRTYPNTFSHYTHTHIFTCTAIADTLLPFTTA